MKYGQNIVITPKREMNVEKKEVITLSISGKKRIELSGGEFKLNLLVKKGDAAELELIYEGSEDVLEEMNLVVEKDASLIVSSILNKPSGMIVQERKIKQEGEVIWKETLKGGEYVKNSIESELLGGSLEILITYQAKNESQYDVFTKAVHVKKSTSNMKTKAIVDDNSKGLSRGLIKIEEGAFGSVGYEKMDTLIFGGEADAIPNLEIHNHDVTCSHGATISKLDEETLFYLESRGLSTNDAKELLISAFLGEKNE